MFDDAIVNKTANDPVSVANAEHAEPTAPIPDAHPQTGYSEKTGSYD